MTMINADGAKLYVEETGTGYPIVFVHEFGADHREWESQVRYFSRQYRCITFNARGYPPSDVPASAQNYGWEQSRDDIAAVMRGLAIGKAHIVGLSMGAYATLQFGLRYPEMASALVVAGVGTGSPPEIHKEWRTQSEALGRDFLENGMHAMAELTAHSPTRIQLFKKDPRAWNEFVSHLREHSAEGMSHTVSRYQALRPSLHEAGAALAALSIPVLLAVGDEDEPCLQTNIFLKQKIRSAGLWICPNTGHAINLEEPAAFNAAVLDFLGLAERGKWPLRQA
jgi:pimeloyl-ACP methyl ester carboxylesterase